MAGIHVYREPDGSYNYLSVYGAPFCKEEKLLLASAQMMYAGRVGLEGGDPLNFGVKTDFGLTDKALGQLERKLNLLIPILNSNPFSFALKEAALRAQF